MTAGSKKAPRLAALRSQGTSIQLLDLPDVFKSWLSQHGLLTAESVYGFFYVRSFENDSMLSGFDLNYHRLYDRLNKAIPADKLRQLNSQAQEHYEINEA